MSVGPATDELWVCHLGTIEYRAAAALQERVRARRQAQEIPDVLLLLEHPPVYTRGRRSQEGELPMGEAWYRSQGIDVVDSDRGGKLTYHGPGQLVGYPIMRIADLVAYVRTMETAIIDALGDEAVTAVVRAGLTGVWVEDRKIASIGVHVSRGVTTHGFAINADINPARAAPPTSSSTWPATTPPLTCHQARLACSIPSFPPGCWTREHSTQDQSPSSRQARRSICR